MGEVIKIECKTKEIIKSKKTGKIYKTMEEFLKENQNWKVKEIFTNNNGLTILEKIK